MVYSFFPTFYGTLFPVLITLTFECYNIPIFFSFIGSRSTPVIKINIYSFLFLVHLNNESEFYTLVYREVPVRFVFNFRGSANLGTLYNIYLSYSISFYLFIVFTCDSISFFFTSYFYFIVWCAFI